MTEAALHLIFALGGGLGAVVRHLLTLAITHRFPVSTFIVNVIGCFLLGVGMALMSGQTGLEAEEERRLVTGFCGGFTTFSSFAYQSLDLHRRHSIVHAAVNILLSLCVCIAAFLAGRALLG